MGLIEEMAKALQQHEDSTEYLLTEVRFEGVHIIGRYESVIAAKRQAESNYRDGEPLEWARRICSDGERSLHHGPFAICAVRKN